MFLKDPQDPNNTAANEVAVAMAALRIGEWMRTTPTQATLSSPTNRRGSERKEQVPGAPGFFRGVPA
jgi:hypothetical protein